MNLVNETFIKDSCAGFNSRIVIKSIYSRCFSNSNRLYEKHAVRRRFLLVNKSAYSISTPHQIPFLGKRLSRTELISTGKPEFNDVVAFEIPADYYDPDSEEYSILIKRIIGLPGDTIEIKDQILYINHKNIAHHLISK